MKKVYCVIFDFLGYEERVREIYENEKDAIKRLIAHARIRLIAYRMGMRFEQT